MEYKVVLYNKEYIIKQDVDGYFIMPEELKQYDGTGINLKPSLEPIIIARKPISEKSIAENVLKWGTGGINIDECRILHNEPVKTTKRTQYNEKEKDENRMQGTFQNGTIASPSSKGRFPANLIHDGSDEVVELFPDTKSGFMKKGTSRQNSDNPNKNTYGYWKADKVINDTIGDSGSAARFFYCAKASPKERNFGLEDEQETTTDDGRKKKIDNAFQRGKTLRNNNHPTVKPVRIMRYLTKLVTPPEGVVLDPFMGSGTTGIGCKENGFGFIGIDNVEDYIKLSKKRIINWPVGWLDKTQKKKNKNTKKKNKEKVGKNNDILNKFFDYGQ